MPYTIVPAESGDYVITTVTEDMTRDLARKLAVESNAVGAPLGIRCYLFDFTKSRNVESAIGNYRSTTVDIRSQPEVDRRACVAVLVDPDDHSHEFTEALAKTAGLDMTLFRDREEAISHLKARAQRLNSSRSQATDT